MDNVKLDYKLMGQGDSVIVFENGLGGYYYDWKLVIEAIKSEATIITYHRAGYGHSTSPYLVRTTEQIAQELNKMLEEIDINSEIILVGHSFGGLCVQHFARLYPERVKGVILIDSTSPNFNKLYNLNLPVLYSHIAIEKMVEKWYELSKRTTNELLNVMNPILSEDELKLPKESQNAIIDFITSPSTYKTMSCEVKNWRISSEQIKSSPEFPDVPLYVIARDSDVSVKFYTERGIPEKEAIEYEDMWRQLQHEHCLLSESSKFIIADGSDHNIQLEKPEVVIDCIKELMQL